MPIKKKIGVWNFSLFCLLIFQDSKACSRPCGILLATPDIPFPLWVSRTLCLTIIGTLRRLTWNLLFTCTPHCSVSSSRWHCFFGSAWTLVPRTVLSSSNWVHEREARHVLFNELVTTSFWKVRVGRIPWRRKWQSTPVFWLGKSHGQRSLMAYSPWGHKSLTRVSN